MRIAFALLASVVSVSLAVPALAQGFAGCPPGLAMKGNGCLPPGQARKMSGYAQPPMVVYQPAYPDYRQSPYDYRNYPDYGRSGGSLNIGVTLPLQ